MIGPAEPATRGALVPMERCVCGRMAPAPGYAPIGAYINHCIRYHDPMSLRRFTGMAVPVYCVMCKLCRVATLGATCVACATVETRQAQHQELREREVVRG